MSSAIARASRVTRGRHLAGRLHQGVDVNGDGYMDYVAVGGEASSLRVHLGGERGLREQPDFEIPAGAARSGCFGDAIDFGDVNGDGLADVVVGDYCGGPRGRGAVYVFLGGGRPASGPSYVIHEPPDERKRRAHPHFGIGVAVSDDDGDGIDDVHVTTSCYLDDKEKGLCKTSSRYTYRGSETQIRVDAPAAQSSPAR